MGKFLDIHQNVLHLEQIMNDKFLTCVKLLVGDLPEYFTPDWFKTLWYKADFNQDSNNFPEEYNYHFYDLKRYCGCIEQWMHINGVDKIKYVPMFRENPFVAGQIVTILKGSVVGPTILTENSKVKITRSYSGYLTYDQFIPPAIVWGYSNEYWDTLVLDGKNPEPIVTEKS